MAPSLTRICMINLIDESYLERRHSVVRRYVMRKRHFCGYMKILLDECLNWRLKREFESHEVFTVQDMGWSGITNGELMAKASEQSFEVFVTINKNLPFQQNRYAQRQFNRWKV